MLEHDAVTRREPDAASPSPADPRGPAVVVGLVALTLVALVLRIPRLGESLWYDEIAAWRDYGLLVRDSGIGAILASYHDPANHVLHTFLTWVSSVLLPGSSPEVVLRLPALLFSLGAVPATFLLGRRIASTRVGLFAAALAAVVPVAVLEGTNARGYSMMIFFAAIVTERFMALLDDRGTGAILLYAVGCALGVWSHMMTVFVPIGHAGWLLGHVIATRRVDAKVMRGVVAIGLAAIATIACYAPILDDVIRVRSMFAAASGPRLLGPEGWHALLALGGAWSPLAAVPGLVLVVAGGVLAWRRPTARRGIALALLGLPLAVGLVVASGGFVYARFLLFALPGVLVLAAITLDRLAGRSVIGAALAMVIVTGAGLADLAVRPPRQPLLEATEIVRGHDPRARVLAVGLRHQVLDVYGGDLDLAHSLFHGRDIAPALAAHDPAWLIVLYPAHVSDETWGIIGEAGFVVEARLPGWIDWGGGEVVVFRKVS